MEPRARLEWDWAASLRRRAALIKSTKYVLENV